jgi:hypothetical protein
MMIPGNTNDNVKNVPREANGDVGETYLKPRQGRLLKGSNSENEHRRLPFQRPAE